MRIGNLAHCLGHFLYQFELAASGSRWMSVDRGRVKILNNDNDLRRSMDSGGSPWKVEVERVKGIEPSYEAWEAAVLPLNYTRSGADSSAARRAIRAWRLRICGFTLCKNP